MKINCTAYDEVILMIREFDNNILKEISNIEIIRLRFITELLTIYKVPRYV